MQFYRTSPKWSTVIPNEYIKIQMSGNRYLCFYMHILQHYLFFLFSFSLHLGKNQCPFLCIPVLSWDLGINLKENKMESNDVYHHLSEFHMFKINSRVVTHIFILFYQNNYLTFHHLCWNHHFIICRVNSFVIWTLTVSWKYELITDKCSWFSQWLIHEVTHKLLEYQTELIHFSLEVLL